MAASVQRPAPVSRSVEPAPQPVAVAPQPAEPALKTIKAPEDDIDSLAYDQTIVLPEYSEDDLDTVVQPDLWKEYSGSMIAESAPVTSEQTGSYQQVDESPVDYSGAAPQPARSLDPHQGDDSETMVLVPEMAQQPMQAPSISMPHNLQLTRANGDQCVLTSFPVTVGKGSEADLIIGDNSAISRVHVRILRDGDMFAAEDLGSTNKTYIGDYELPPYTPTILSDGDTLKLGNEVLQVALR